MRDYVKDMVERFPCPDEPEQEEKLYYVTFELPAIVGTEVYASSKEEAEELAKGNITTDSFKHNLLDYDRFDAKVVETEEI